MATIFRPPVVHRPWRRDPAGVAMNAWLDTWDNRLSDLLGSKDQVFGAAGETKTYDWPNPRGKPFPAHLLNYSDTFNLTLIGQDKFYGAAGQTQTYDWPNPIPKRRAIDLLTYIDPSETWLLTDIFFGPPGKPPNYDWPNPRGRPFPSDLRTFVGNLLQSTLGFIQSPFFLGDWPVPRTRPVALDLLTYADPSETWLLQDQFFGIAGQPPSYQPPPNPRGGVYPIELRTIVDASEFWMLRDTFFGVPDQPPTYNPMPNPRGAIYSIDFRTYVDPSETWLLQDQFFGGPGQPLAGIEWPNPRRARGFAADAFVNLLQTTLGILINPFALLDWPMPRRRPYPQDLLTFVDPLKVNLQGQDQFFGAPGMGPAYDWPVPRSLRRPISVADPLNLLETTLAIIVQSPFALLHWPNPRAAGFARSLLTFTDALKIHLQGQDTFFGVPGQAPVFDWPLPRRARAPLTFADALNLLQSTLGITPSPFALLSWPNPLRRPFTPDANILNLLGTTLVQPAPFAFLGWVNPRGPIYPADLRTFLNTLKLTLLGRDQFFGLPGQPPTYQPPPNPRGKPYPPQAWLRQIMINPQLGPLLLFFLAEQLRGPSASDETLKGPEPDDETFEGPDESGESLR